MRPRLIRLLARLEDVLTDGKFVLDGSSISKFISRRNVDGFATSLYMRGTGFYIFVMLPVSVVKPA